MLINSLLTNVQELKNNPVVDSLIKVSQTIKGKASHIRHLAGTKLGNSQHQSLMHDQDFLTVPLCWAATTPKQPFANYGDALSPVIVSALSGLPITHERFTSKTKRLACVGTIGHGLKNGDIRFWGTGVDKEKNPVNSNKYYQRPPNTQFLVHALRGPLSAQTFKQQGIPVPEIYGDPVWFLPSIIPPASEKRYELGVIVHLSELTELTEQAGVKSKLLRYNIPESLASEIHLITTIVQPTFDALEEKTKEITACKRIVSTSLHGLVIAEAYGIPCAYFPLKGKGVAFPTLEDESEPIDHRMRDFYRGVGLEKRFVYGQRLGKETNWERVIRAIDQYWQPIDWSPEAFLEAFPLPLAFNPLRDTEIRHRLLLSQIKL